MVASRPRLRGDLTVSRQETPYGPVMVVKAPVSEELFRFREEEAFIARQLDGATSSDVIRRRTEQQFRAPLSAGRLDAFIGQLERAGLLEPGEAVSRAWAERRGRMRGDMLHLRLKLADPNALLDRLSPGVRGLFTRRFVAFSAVVIALGMATVVTHWSEVTLGVAGLFRLAAIPPLLLVTFLVLSAHEFAHALTCKRFGGEVHEMGFMLIYFQPALYCNVSDAWLFPEKWKRLWVGFAGPYFELFLWASAVLVWRVTAVETWIHDVALLVMAASGARTLLNLIPLIKLDGYYLLSDYLDIPNLRRKSFRYVGNRIKRLSGLANDGAETVTARERRIYLTYGILAMVFSIIVLVMMTVHVGGFLIDHRQPLALLALGGLVGARLKKRLGKVFGGTAPRVPRTARNEVSALRISRNEVRTLGIVWNEASALRIAGSEVKTLGIARNGASALGIAGSMTALRIARSGRGLLRRPGANGGGGVSGDGVGDESGWLLSPPSSRRGSSSCAWSSALADRSPHCPLTMRMCGPRSAGASKRSS